MAVAPETHYNPDAPRIGQPDASQATLGTAPLTTANGFAKRVPGTSGIEETIDRQTTAGNPLGSAQAPDTWRERVRSMSALFLDQPVETPKSAVGLERDWRLRESVAQERLKRAAKGIVTGEAALRTLRETQVTGYDDHVLVKKGLSADDLGVTTSGLPVRNRKKTHWKGDVKPAGAPTIRRIDTSENTPASQEKPADTLHVKATAGSGVPAIEAGSIATAAMYGEASPVDATVELRRVPASAPVEAQVVPDPEQRRYSSGHQHVVVTGNGMGGRHRVAGHRASDLPSPPANVTGQKPGQQRAPEGLASAPSNNRPPQVRSHARAWAHPLKRIGRAIKNVLPSSK